VNQGSQRARGDLAALVPDVINAVQPIDGVLTGGQLDRAQLQRLADAGVRAVVDLRLPFEPRGFDEASAARDAGMEYIPLPMGGVIADDSIDRLRAILAAAARRPVVLHCASGNRVGAALIPYLVLDLGMEVEAALQTALRVGLRSPALAGEAIGYINRGRR
jgi:uncharacterized protein (TIGR01244 family)